MTFVNFIVDLSDTDCKIKWFHPTTPHSEVGSTLSNRSESLLTKLAQPQECAIEDGKITTLMGDNGLDVDDQGRHIVQFQANFTLVREYKTAVLTRAKGYLLIDGISFGEGDLIKVTFKEGIDMGRCMITAHGLRHYWALDIDRLFTGIPTRRNARNSPYDTPHDRSLRDPLPRLSYSSPTGKYKTR